MNPRPIFPTIDTQMRRTPLIVCPGLNGYRLAFAGGDRFEVIAEFKTHDEAYAAYKQARAALSCL